MLLVAGCASGNKLNEAKVKAPSAKPEEPRPTRTVRTDSVDILQRDDKRVTIWRVQSDTSDVTIDPEGLVSGQLNQVRGEYFQEGKAVSRFRADRASADQATQKLNLGGRVEVVSKDPAMVMSAQQVEWNAKTRRLLAKGDVRLSNDAYEMGPFAELWASPDLKEVGTPGNWKTKE